HEASGVHSGGNMAQRIRRFGVGQTAKVMGVLYGLIGVVFIPFILIAAKFAPEQSGFGVGFAVALPVIYALFGFVFTAIVCAIYNLVAGWTGGVEVMLDDAAV
ncbi:MAG: hypothetical protein ABIR58_07450, partial [Gemmatimonadaceae bacterium]